MPIQPQWQDRRGMFQRGREVHEPSTSKRRASEASVAEALAKTVSASSMSSAADPKSPVAEAPAASSPVTATPGLNSSSMFTGQRRRSSTASSSSGMFASLTAHKRGSDDYSARRNSFFEMEGKPGFLSGMWNSTFRGMQKVKDETVSKVAGTDAGQTKAPERKTGALE